MDKIEDKKVTKGINPNKDCNTPKIKGKNRGKKRKRESSNSSSEYEDVLPDNTLEMEKNLHVSAMKNNLDDISVRKILKKVVTNDHVLALVKLREEEEAVNGPKVASMRPKLTRAKMKELQKVSPNTTLGISDLTPIKHIPVKTRPEVKALIAQELPEDEDDEEYEPTNEDVPSDDDQGLESCSDLDSQPRTPATPHSVVASSPKVVTDGPFKVPQEISTPIRRKLNMEEEATIALRTRSKLSLSSTSIEHIESTFVPPDDIPTPAVDDLWNQFLNECLNPASTSKEGRNEDDDETDPEYNVAADADAHDEDEEALSHSIIKISKKELNDLVTELFSIMPEATEEELLADNIANSVLTDHSQTDLSRRWEGKQEPVSDDESGNRQNLSDRITFEEERKKMHPRVSIGKSDPVDSEEETRAKPPPKKKPNKIRSKPEIGKTKTSVLEHSVTVNEQRAPPLLQHRLKQVSRNECVLIEVAQGVQLLPAQRQVLQQQLRQHVQLCAGNYLQLYVHPLHWKLAHHYKDYLETLKNLSANNPASVVNVCNLQPALDLVNSWEKAVSADTPENTAMLEFIQNQLERTTRRVSHKALYVGDFHETFLKTVSTSNVFLYPYLLPAMPYRGDTTRRLFYLNSEDELIALGLDQFSAYVSNNPSLFKPHPRPHPRHRWGLRVTLELVVKYMFPWMSAKSLHSHIQTVRKLRCIDNPIYKYLETGELNPVHHKLLPFNPQLSLYEQPEHELPRIWLRYLAKTSKRFRNYLMKRTKTTGVAPNGVEISSSPVVVQKAALPIDFTKPIPSFKPVNSTPKPQNTTQQINFEVVISSASVTTLPNQYKLVETSTGAYLLPITPVTITVDSNTSPIPTPVVVTPVKTPNLPETTKTVQNPDHCTCCVLLRKICKQRQTVITEYFGSKKAERCECKEKRYPRVSNKLRLFINCYKDSYQSALEDIQMKINKVEDKRDTRLKEINCDNNIDDLAYITSFNLKLISRLTIAKDVNLKRRVNTVLHRFNTLEHDPLQLASSLDKVFGVELADLYKEFISLLTPQQAAQMGAFKDYFVRNCVPGLVKRVEVEVLDGNKKRNILEVLQRVFTKNLSTACEICTDILKTLVDYPGLARYVHSLFPHRKEASSEQKHSTSEEQTTSDEGQQTETLNNAPCEEPTVGDTIADYEGDQSMSDDDDSGNISQPESNFPIKTENALESVSTQQASNNLGQIIVSKTEIEDHSESSDSSMRIVFDDEIVKSENPEWKRDEDKLILEVLKEQLTPEEREDKTILEIIEEKNIILMISESLTDKSESDIKTRLLYLLQLC
ncbi:GON-4-like protein isoform X2 [Trichoplusia ni]|uniref:GON-4-like protein isoform X2 n=1 Tax=Trichoplusia ni TaxID=7111 RepID=A0A7E5WS82_TRINI|nr:GON-4-like protein isoform X2 [Trichoplusia ni]